MSSSCLQWPTVVAVMGNWFDKSTRGLVMTVWNSHTSVGNIVGKTLSSYALGISGGEADLDAGNNWPATFFVCGGLISTMSVLIFFFLKNSPEDAGLQKVSVEPEDPDRGNPLLSTGVTEYGTSESQDDESEAKESAGILRALAIPGVIEFAMSLFFCKFVAYTFIYWLPYYLGHVGFPAETAGYLSIFFDLGGIPGGVIAGVVSDKFGDRGVVIFVYLALTIPSLYAYRAITENLGDSALGIHIVLMLFLGALVNGPYALITTAVSADLGQHRSLKGSKALMATVAGIIDGTGSIGAAAQGLVIGALASSCRGWNAVFSALQFASAMSALCLVRMMLVDIEATRVTCLRRVACYTVVLALGGSVLYSIITMVQDCGIQNDICK